MQVADKIIGDIIKWVGIASVDVVFSFVLTGLGDGLVLQYGHIATPGMYITFGLSPQTIDTIWIAFAVDFFLWFLVVGRICVAVMRYLEKKKSTSAASREPADPRR
jgi:hypothetical protein